MRYEPRGSGKPRVNAQDSLLSTEHEQVNVDAEMPATAAQVNKSAN